MESAAARVRGELGADEPVTFCILPYGLNYFLNKTPPRGQIERQHFMMGADLIVAIRHSLHKALQATGRPAELRFRSADVFSAR